MRFTLPCLFLVSLAASPAAAQKPFTGLVGTVMDGSHDEPVIDAAVKATNAAGVTKTVRADIDGAYRLSLASGQWDVTVYYEFYKSRRLRIELEPGEARTLDVTLEPDEGEIQEVVVEVKADTRTEAALLSERKRATTVRDAISAQEMSRTPDSSASDAVKRVVSATVVDGRYVVLRGLGGRYSTTLLNGIAVPSPEPDEPSVPLDLFPTSLLSNLTVVKSHSPELPGHFSGGALLIETNSFPAKREWKLKLGLSGDSINTIGRRLNDSGGAFDWLGFDDGRRSLPAAVPADRPLRASEAGSPGLSRAEREAIGESFRQDWTLRDSVGLPNGSLGVTLGDTTSLGGGRLGYLASFGYGRSEKSRVAEVRKLRLNGGEAELRESLVQRVGVETATLSALANVGWQPKDGQDVGFLALYSRSGEGTAASLRGFSESDVGTVEASQQSWVERALAFAQLRGDHRLGKTRLGWQANLSHTGRSEPDTRDMKHLVRDDDRRQFMNGTGSAERFWSELDDVAGGASVHATHELSRLTGRAGASVQASSRQFDARRIRFDVQENTIDPGILFLPPEEMLSAENIGPGFLPVERTLATDSYAASLVVGAGFAGVEATPVDDLRLSAGGRMEASRQVLTSGSPFAAHRGSEAAVDRTEVALLPSASLVWAVGESTNLRAAYGYTLSRPQFRELAPFFYFDFNRARGTSGNPGLTTTRIHNADLRWEHFRGDHEVFAASAFYKAFVNPIERIIVNTAQGDTSYANAQAAQAYGLELEARIGLGRLSSKLDDFRFQTNVSLIASSVQLSPEQKLAQTNAERALQGQSPYIVNAGLSWAKEAWGLEASVLYNVAGARLDEVGVQGLPDVYEQPIHRLDATIAKSLPHDLKLKASASNLLAQDVVLEQAGFVVHRYSPGVSAGVGIEWSP